MQDSTVLQELNNPIIAVVLNKQSGTFWNPRKSVPVNPIKYACLCIKLTPSVIRLSSCIGHLKNRHISFILD